MVRDMQYSVIKQIIFKRCKTINPKIMNAHYNLFKKIYNNQINETEIQKIFLYIENKINL